MSKQKGLFGGVAVLMPAALFTKFVGLFYKIPLIAVVGVAGMAYFLAAYHVYAAIFMLSAGLPAALSLAVSRAMAAGRHRAARRTLLVAMALFLSVGLLGTLALLRLAPILARRIAMAESAAAMIAIAPALLLSCFVGAVKGYFQGLGQMLPTAVSEVLEALGKLVFGLSLAWLAVKRGLPVPAVAAYAVFGITAGLLLAALVLAVWLLLQLWRHPTPPDALKPPRCRRILWQLCGVALPITANALVMSISSLIDTALISSRLQAAGLAPAAANALYSAYGNLAMPLYNLVPALLAPVTMALMPLLGAATSVGEQERGRAALSAALRFTVLVALPASLGLAVFARPLLGLLFGGRSATVEPAVPLLTLLALSVLPVALIGVLGAALQATGHTVLPAVAMTVGALIKLTLEFFLLTLPPIYALGAPISTLVCNLAVLTIEAVALSRFLPYAVLPVTQLLIPLAAALPAVGAGGALYVGLLSAFPTADWIILPPLALVVVLYGALALRFGAVGREELAVLPLGDRLCVIFEKCRLLRTKT